MVGAAATASSIRGNDVVILIPLPAPHPTTSGPRNISPPARQKLPHLLHAPALGSRHDTLGDMPMHWWIARREVRFFSMHGPRS